MSILRIYTEQASDPEIFDSPTEISGRLQALGVRFERWPANALFTRDATDTEILSAYSDSITRLKQLYGFQSEDVISVKPDNPDRVALRARFLREHTHSDFEVRFFVEGCGVFFLHPDNKVYAVLCEQGDLISVPAQIKHWFDMGEYPDLKCIRLFSSADGWVADYSGSDIAERFPRLEHFIGDRV